MKPTITGLLIAVVLISLFAGIFSIYIVRMGDFYGVPTDNSTLDHYNNMVEINQNIEEIKTNTTTLKENTGVLDVIGNYFSNAYKILILTPKSTDMVANMAQQGIKDVGVGEGADILYTALIAILTILIVVGIIMSILLKTDVL